MSTIGKHHISTSDGWEHANQGWMRRSNIHTASQHANSRKVPLKWNVGSESSTIYPQIWQLGDSCKFLAGTKAYGVWMGMYDIPTALAARRQWLTKFSRFSRLNENVQYTHGFGSTPTVIMLSLERKMVERWGLNENVQLRVSDSTIKFQCCHWPLPYRVWPSIWGILLVRSRVKPDCGRGQWQQLCDKPYKEGR